MPVNTCPHCGAKLFGALVERCYRCGKSVSVAEETKKAQERRRAQEAENMFKQRDPEMRLRYATIFDAFSRGNGCIYDVPIVSGEPVLTYEGLKAWEFFVLRGGIEDASYTCLLCEKCKYLHVVTIPFQSDLISAGKIFSISRATSRQPADWYANFTCKKCNTAHERIPVIVSRRSDRLQHYNDFGEYWVLNLQDPFDMKALARLKSYNRKAEKAQMKGIRWCPRRSMRSEYVKRPN